DECIESLKAVILSHGNDNQKKLICDFYLRYKSGDLTGNDIEAYRLMHDCFLHKMPEYIAKTKFQLEG
ncbi:MAG TPA: hypothetical protein VEF53_06700, partial [Patescibacteria group bacterium]|nr:hypothetical protein [Patescibacteria group bacterium]